MLCSALAVSKLRSKTSAPYFPTDHYLNITPITGISAIDVGVGADGTLWVISNEKTGNDYKVYRQKDGSTTWENMDGVGTRISVAPDGNAWVVRSDKNIYKYDGLKWVQVSGSALDISCSPDGSVYHIGLSSTFYRLNSDGKSWSQVSGNGVNIAGGMSRSLWSITSNSNIYIRNPVEWEQVGTRGADIACSRNGLTWIVTTSAWPNQFAAYDEMRKEWVYVPLVEHLAQSGPNSLSDSSTVRIAAAPNGDLIGVKKDGSMFRMRFNWGDN